MAIVKTITPKIKTQAHLAEALAYITQDKKASDVFYHNCTSRNDIYQTARDFENYRIAINRNDGILAVHLVQSFSPEDKITPDIAHEIGIETIKKCFPDYQVVLATHNDREHLHNHFMINSPSLLDKKKFLDNMKTLNQIRKVSDELCYMHNISVIQKDNVTTYAPLDQKTLSAAKQGRSWKFGLVKDLDAALKECHNKNEFINFFISHEYEIKFTNQNITFKKSGEKKGIRADTLAKQFGKKYSKASIEKKLNIGNSDNKKTKSTSPENKQRFQVPNYDYYNQIAAVNWQRYEKKYGGRIRFNDNSFFNRNLFSKNPVLFSLRLINYVLHRVYHNKPKKKIKSYKNGFKIKTSFDYKYGKKIIANISYKTLIDTFGETVRIKLYAWQVTKLLNDGVLLSSRLDIKTGTAMVTLKKTDLDRAATLLGVSYDRFAEQAENIKNRSIIADLKKNNPKLSYLLITSEQAENLSEHCVKFARYRRGDKINIAFAPEDKEKVFNVLYPNRDEKVNRETFFKRNSGINRKLKEISEETGEKLCYKIVLSNQYKALRKTTLEFAVFRTDDGKYNVVFLEHNKSAIEKALGGDFNVRKNNNNRNIQNPKI